MQDQKASRGSGQHDAIVIQPAMYVGFQTEGYKASSYPQLMDPVVVIEGIAKRVDDVKAE
jgi:hypothetical protein